jgi:AraC-like DNA-binding protein
MTKNIEFMPNRTNLVMEPTPEGTLDAIPRAMAWRVSELVSGSGIAPHRHQRAQLLYASAGVMTVSTENGIWVVPPHRAVWVPHGHDHGIQANTHLSLRNLYINPGKVTGLSRNLGVVAVPRLLRELILEMIALPVLYDEHGADGRLVEVVLDRIRSLDTVPLHLPLPASVHPAKVAAAITGDLADNKSIDDWAREVGTSGRTLARRFQQETGMSFGQWRQQARLLEAMRLLADGVAVTTVALDLGYSSQSAFIAMFRKALGKTPGKYFAA